MVESSNWVIWIPNPIAMGLIAFKILYSILGLSKLKIYHLLRIILFMSALLWTTKRRKSTISLIRRSQSTLMSSTMRSLLICCCRVGKNPCRKSWKNKWATRNQSLYNLNLIMKRRLSRLEKKIPNRTIYWAMKK